MSNQTDVIIEVDNVSQIFSTGSKTTVALEEVSLSISKGEFLSLVGPSGCGKSTLLRALSGLSVPTSGEIRFEGKKVTEPEPMNTGVVFQEARLFPWKTALDNVLFPIIIQGGDKKQAVEDAMQLLELVGLKGFEMNYPHELSGGMKQRVSIARGLIQKPQVLLMDEPFGALDEFTRETMGFELLRIWKNTGVTIVFVTHSIDEAITLSDRIAVMTPRPGRLLQILDVNLPRPRDRETVESSDFVELRAYIRERFQHGADTGAGTI